MPNIGSWDNTGLTFAALPICYKNPGGSNPSAFNSGNLSAFYLGESAGGTEDAVLTNMASGYGYTTDGDVSGDGVNDHVLIENFSQNISLNSGFTVSMSIKVSDPTADKYFWSMEYTGRSAGIFFEQASRKLWFFLYSSGVYTAKTIANAMLWDEWVTIHGVKSGATLKIYVNGVDATSTSESYPDYNATYTTSRIFGSQAAGYYPVARFRWTALYNNARSTTNITADHANAATFYGLIGINDAPGTDKVFDSLLSPGSSISISDSVSISESVNVALLGDLSATTSDSVSISESLSPRMNLGNVSVSESVSISENLSLNIVSGQSTTITRPNDFDYTISDFIDSSIGGVFSGTSISNLAVTMVSYDDDNHTYVSGDVSGVNLTYSGGWHLDIPASVTMRLPYNHYTITITGDEIDPYEVEGDIAGADAVLVLYATISDSVTASDTVAKQFDRYNVTVSDSVAITERLAVTPDRWLISVSDNVSVTDVIIQNVKSHGAGGELEGAFSKPAFTPSAFTPPAFKGGRSFR
jgi:hypothetical protein